MDYQNNGVIMALLLKLADKATLPFSALAWMAGPFIYLSVAWWGIYITIKISSLPQWTEMAWPWVWGILNLLLTVGLWRHWKRHSPYFNWETGFGRIVLVVLGATALSAAFYFFIAPVTWELTLRVVTNLAAVNPPPEFLAGFAVATLTATLTAIGIYLRRQPSLFNDF